MQHCPKCNATLPDFAKSCQFCGDTWSGAPLPPGTKASKVGAVVNSLSWVKPAYYGIAVWWIVGGVWSVLTGAGVFGNPGGFGIIDVLLGSLTALVGLGLVLHVDLVRGIVNVLCFLQILGGLRSLVFFFFSPFVGGFLGVVLVMMAFFQIGLAGLMIFLIGETETRGPNF